MCARRFLIAIFILTLLFVAGAFAFFQFGQDVLIRQAIPKGSFVAPVEQGPDYASTSAWIAHPGVADSPAAWLPDGYVDASIPQVRDVAVFYIHPTTYLRNDRWNAPVDDAESRDRADLFARSQASALSAVGQVWAPKYRQAAFGAFLLDSKDAQASLNLAYGDVVRAFDRFLAQAGDRPIILAGHSQGALHLLRLLREKVTNPEVKNRLVAAYVVGWPISAKADLPALGFPACASDRQIGCILSWMSFGEPANPDLVLQTYEGSAGLSGAERDRKDMVCVNPLTGTSGGNAPPSANPGTLVPTADLRAATLAPARVGARCDDGLLLIGGDVPPLGPYVLPGNNYHVYDFALFWSAIRADAVKRSEAFARP